MLKIEDLQVFYGGIHALKGISLEVPENKIITLIGANGAGKSTTLRAICNQVPAASGKVYFQGEDITGKPTADIIKKGITLVPEGRRIFANLTVMENLQMGAYARKDKQGIHKDIQKVFELFPRLKEREWQVAGTLSGGEQQMLAIGRALMSRPRLLMMDEPSLGLAPLLVREVFRIIRDIMNPPTANNAPISASVIESLLSENNLNNLLFSSMIMFLFPACYIVFRWVLKRLLMPKIISYLRW